MPAILLAQAEDVKLSGHGIAISPLAASAMTFDMADAGYRHRTAWAGTGDPERAAAGQWAS